MSTIIFLPVMFLVIYIVLFSIVDEIPKSFVARLALVLFLIFASLYHINSAINMNELTPGASEWKRNAMYFTGVFQIAFAVGLLFIKSLKWTSIALIVFLVLLSIFSLLGVFTEYGFIDNNVLDYPTLWKVAEYFGVIVWTYLFGIHFASSKGIVGWDVEKS